jgi:hypothetical protein
VRSPRAIRAARSDTLVLFQVDMWRRGCRTTRRRRDRSRTWRRGARSEACASGRRDQESPSIHRERRVRPGPTRAIGGALISAAGRERAMSSMPARSNRAPPHGIPDCHLGNSRVHPCVGNGRACSRSRSRVVGPVEACEPEPPDSDARRSEMVY